MQSLPTLYKRTQTGAVQQWTITVDSNSYYTEYGQVDGALTKTKPTRCEGKNEGRSNETTPEQQAQAEAQAKWQKQLDGEYTQNIEKIDEALDRNFRPMLAHKYEDHVDKIKFPCIGQPKLDGIRCIATTTGAYSRNGKPHCAIPHILAALKPVFEKYPNAIFDGELYNHELKEDFEKICSLVKKTKPSVVDLLESAEMVKYYIYDCPQIDEYSVNDPFINRYKFMWTMIQGMILTDQGSIRVVENIEIVSAENIREAHDRFVANGYEGLMLRDGKAPYQQKRSHKLLKVKVFTDEEFRIVAVQPGRGNKANMAGRVVCRMKSGATFSAGINGTNEYCKKMLDEREEIEGKMGTIVYFNLTSAGIPRFPKLKAIRDYE